MEKSDKCDALRAWLRAAVAEQAGRRVDDIAADQPFDGYGLDSLDVIHITRSLEERLETKLPATLLYDYDTIDALAEALLRLQAQGGLHDQRP